MSGPGGRALAAGDVHVWLARLDPPAPVLAALEATLAPEERERAGRYRVSRERERFVAARGLLRRLLGEYLGADPAAIAFRYGEQGKPELAERWAGAGLGFNVSHAGGMAMLAVARGCSVGVDLELEREVHNAPRVAARVFSEAELAWWQALDDAERRGGFFRLWTRLEALAKLRGQGVWQIARGGVARDEPGRLVRDLDAPPGFAAAIAVEGGRRVVQREWSWG